MAPHTRVGFVDSLSLEHACIARNLWSVPALQVLENRGAQPACFAVAEGDADATPGATLALMSSTISRAAAVALAYLPPGGVPAPPLPAMRLAAAAALPQQQPEKQQQQPQQQAEQTEQAAEAAPMQARTRWDPLRTLPGDGLGSSARAAASRLLGETLPGAAAANSSAAGRAVVTLLPGASSLTVDAYSGLPRRVEAADLPICTPSQQAEAAAGRCLQAVTLRTRSDSMLLSLQLGGPAGAPLTQDAVVCTGPADSVYVAAPGSLSGGQLYDVLVMLPATGEAVTCSIPAGHLAPWGLDNAASNSLVLVRDQQPPQVRCQPPRARLCGVACACMCVSVSVRACVLHQPRCTVPRPPGARPTFPCFAWTTGLHEGEHAAAKATHACTNPPAPAVPRPPQPAITTPDNHLVTQSTQIGFTVSFGEQVAGSNPLALFNMSGTSRADVVYEPEAGVLSILAYVDDPGADADVT